MLSARANDAEQRVFPVYLSQKLRRLNWLILTAILGALSYLVIFELQARIESPQIQKGHLIQHSSEPS